MHLSNMHSPELLKGTLQTIILKLLTDNSRMYGYEITQHVKDLSDGTIIGLMAGFYPSFLLFAFKPVNVLKGHATSGLRGQFVRSALVVFQFVISIFLIVGRDFGKLVFIAFIMAAPAAWFAVEWWLSSYTYKTEIGFPVYAFAGVLAFFIALVTMTYQALKAALVNPVTSLRNE